MDPSPYHYKWASRISTIRGHLHVAERTSAAGSSWRLMRWLQLERAEVMPVGSVGDSRTFSVMGEQRMLNVCLWLNNRSKDMGLILLCQKARFSLQRKPLLNATMNMRTYEFFFKLKNTLFNLIILPPIQALGGLRQRDWEKSHFEIYACDYQCQNRLFLDVISYLLRLVRQDWVIARSLYDNTKQKFSRKERSVFFTAENDILD